MTEKELRESAIESIRSKVCGERLKEYGSVESNFGRIAEFWNVWLKGRGVVLGLEDVAAMMMLMKMARLIENRFHLDSAIDAGGYAVCWSVLAMREEKKKELEKELDGIAPAVDHGDEELKKTGRVLRCGAADSNRNQCVLLEGHVSDHAFESYYPHTK